MSEWSNERSKFALILADSLEPGMAANAVAHLSAQFGALCPEIAGTRIKDESGTTHSGVPVVPNVILKTKENRLRRLIGDARDTDGVLLVDFPEEAYSTNTDQDFCASVSAKREENLRYLAALLFGNEDCLRKLTKRCSLYC